MSTRSNFLDSRQGSVGARNRAGEVPNAVPCGQGQGGHTTAKEGGAPTEVSKPNPAPQTGTSTRGAVEAGQGGGQASWYRDFEQALQVWNETFIPARG